MVFLWSKIIESFGDYASVVLKACIRVLLQALNLLLMDNQLSAGRVTAFLESVELGAQLAKRDEPLGLPVLISTALTSHFVEFLRSHLSLSIGFLRVALRSSPISLSSPSWRRSGVFSRFETKPHTAGCSLSARGLWELAQASRPYLSRVEHRHTKEAKTQLLNDIHHRRLGRFKKSRRADRAASCGAREHRTGPFRPSL